MSHGGRSSSCGTGDAPGVAAFKRLAELTDLQSEVVVDQVDDDRSLSELADELAEFNAEDDDEGGAVRDVKPQDVKPQYDLVALRAKLNRPTYNDRLRAAARRAARENPAASRAETFKRAAEIAGPPPRHRGRRVSHPESRVQRRRYATVLGSAVDAFGRLRARRDVCACQTRHRRAPSASARRRRGSRRATGSGDRAGPGDDSDLDEPAGHCRRSTPHPLGCASRAQRRLR